MGIPIGTRETQKLFELKKMPQLNEEKRYSYVAKYKFQKEYKRNDLYLFIGEKLPA
jgi:hypothetical protein